MFGAIKAAGGIQRSTLLVHGPKGCVYHINYILGMRGDRPSEIYSTCLDENDIIFGAEQKLRDAIEELLCEKDPDLLVVLSCCASSIIGEDVESAVRDAGRIGRVIAIPSGGFEGDFRTGYSETLRRLAEDLAREPATVDPRSVNLIGLLRGGPDLQELRRIIDWMGLRINTVLTAGATVSEIENLGAAALNIVLCEASGLEAAEALQKRFNTPFIRESLPIGPEATLSFMHRIGEALGIPVDLPGLGEVPEIDGSLLKDRRIAIIGGPTRALSMSRFLRDLGTMPRLVVLDFDMNKSEEISRMLGPESRILVEPEQEEITHALEEMGIDLVIGGLLEKPLAESLGIDHLDIMHGSQNTLGFSGAEHLVHLLARKSQDRRC